ncbi:uncharacterized protein [Prorops nasuta]|uniref:uncharacterized protein n=1 Tax=Prorops nasuta TaxID=863751 RepID=UPI0034CD9212
MTEIQNKEPVSFTCKPIHYFHLSDHCQYSGCSKCRYNKEGKEVNRFFTFPLVWNRRKVWIENCGNEELLHAKSNNDFHKSGICSDHFHESDFETPSKTSLKPDAVPIPYYQQNQTKRAVCPIIAQSDNDIIPMETDHSSKENNEEEMSSKNKEISETAENQKDRVNDDKEDKRKFHDLTDEEIIYLRQRDKTKKFINKIADDFHEIPDFFNLVKKGEHDKIIPEPQACLPCVQTQLLHMENIALKLNNIKWKKSNEELKIKIKSLQKSLERMRNKDCNKTRIGDLLKRKNIDAILEVFNVTSPAARALCTLQMRLPKSPFTQEEIDFSRDFYKFSPTAMNYLRKLGCHLPSDSTIKRWISEKKKCEDLTENVNEAVAEIIEQNEAIESLETVEFPEHFIVGGETFENLMGASDIHIVDNFTTGVVEETVGYIPDDIF